MRFSTDNLQLFGLDLGRLAQRWWRGLQQMIPAGLEQAFLHPSPRLQAQFDEQVLRFVRVWPQPGGELVCLNRDELQLVQQDVLQAQLLGGQARQMLQLDMLLPESYVMRREVVLPRAAETDLRAALSFQISRLTPFSVDKLFYDVLVLDGELSGETIRVELVAALKEQVQPLLEQVEKVSGLQVSRLQVASHNPHQVNDSNLLTKPQVKTLWWKRLNSNSWLAFIVCVALAFAMVVPVIKLRYLVHERKQEVIQLNTQVADLHSTRQVLENDLVLLNYLLEKKQDNGNYASILEELTRIMPDEVYLNNLRISKGVLSITGLGSNVVQLIDLLNASPMFTGAKFTAAVSRSSNNLDLFGISVQLEHQQDDN